MISFNDFAEMELRVAKIISVEDHPQADKLLVLHIDVGGKQKQIVAGIKGHYAAEELQGKLIIVVNNLAPAVLRGVESQGMLLATQTGERIVLLVPDSDVPPGSEVT